MTTFHISWWWRQFLLWVSLPWLLQLVENERNEVSINSIFMEAEFLYTVSYSREHLGWGESVPDASIVHICRYNGIFVSSIWEDVMDVPCSCFHWNETSFGPCGHFSGLWSCMCIGHIWVGHLNSNDGFFLCQLVCGFVHRFILFV